MNWIDNELSSIDLGDKRLDVRAAKLMKNLTDRPETSIPGASGMGGNTTCSHILSWR
ncbi:MAG: hypothetical protein ACJAWL_002969 [Motiliproteus sp.]|jgi:hypothetical protein